MPVTPPAVVKVRIIGTALSFVVQDSWLVNIPQPWRSPGLWSLLDLQYTPRRHSDCKGGNREGYANGFPDHKKWIAFGTRFVHMVLVGPPKPSFSKDPNSMISPCFFVCCFLHHGVEEKSSQDVSAPQKIETEAGRRVQRRVLPFTGRLRIFKGWFFLWVTCIP